MAQYRYLAYDLRTNAALADLALSGVRYGGALNASGPFSANTSAVPSAALAAATIPERTLIYVERDGVLMDAYLLWRRTRRGQGSSWALQGASLASIMRRERLVSDLTYSGTDQFTIAQALVNAMQAQAGANFGITVGSSTCGVTRDRVYHGYERRMIGELLDQLAAVSNGFDWAIDVAWSSATNPVPTKTLTLSYPRRGRIAGSTGIIFESGKNLIDYEVTEDGSRSARSVDILGAGDGVDMHISTATRTDLIDAGYPLTAEVLPMKDITVDATLAAHATAEVNARAATPMFWRITVDPDDVDGGLGTWIVGDDVLLRITDANFPLQASGNPGYEAHHRIVDFEVSVGDQGTETVSITLGQVGP